MITKYKPSLAEVAMRGDGKSLVIRKFEKLDQKKAPGSFFQ